MTGHPELLEDLAVDQLVLEAIETGAALERARAASVVLAFADLQTRRQQPEAAVALLSHKLIVEVARSKRPTLIVLGDRHRGPRDALRHARDWTAQRAPCSVLIARSELR